MKRAIITGATGAIGTALIQELIEREVEILVLCRADSKRLENIPKHPLVTVKNCSLEQLSTLENEGGKAYDVFFHFAWEGTVNPYRDDMFLQNKNVKYALDAVAVAQKFGCHTFIGAGSQAEYGRVEGLLTPETPTFPENGYGMAKLCAGQMTRVYAHKLGLKHIWARVLSVYGQNDGMQSLVMSTISKLKNGESPKLTKGEQQWDYLFSQDAAKAFYLAAEKGIDGKIYVLGSGEARPIREYVTEIRNMVSPDFPLTFGEVPYAEKQVMYLCADTSQLRQDTGWTPQVEFSEGIKRILQQN